MDAVLFTEIRFYGHLRRRQGLFVPCRHPILRAPKSRIAYVVYRLSAIFLSTSSVQHFGRQVYKLSATNRGCLQVEYSSTTGSRSSCCMPPRFCCCPS
jgi:hypothetical protein